MKTTIRKAFRQYFGHLGVIEDMPDTKLVDFLRDQGLIVPTEHLEHDVLIDRLHHEMSIAERDFTSSNGGRHTTGTITSGDPQDLYFALRELNRAEPLEVTSIAMLRAVLDVIRASAPADTPSVLERRVRQIPDIRMNQEESRGLLELLGHCGILQTPEHRGFQEQFTYLGLAPRKSHSSDWCYPVDWWKGEHGVNEEAVVFWFGKYLNTPTA